MAMTLCRSAARFTWSEGTLIAKPRASSTRDLRLDLDLPFHREWTPGQFVMVRWGRHEIGRPFAIVDWQPTAGGRSKMSLWVRRLGRGTEELTHLSAGTPFHVWAPLGQGLTAGALDSTTPLLLVSGGVGAASLWPVAEHRERAGLDGRDLWIHGERDPMSMDREFADAAPEGLDVVIETGDGARGRVTDALAQLSEDALSHFSAAVVCGPTPMLEAVAKHLEQRQGFLGKPVWLGFEEKMGCGVGLCFSCSVKTDDQGPVRLCTEGPWFEASRTRAHFAWRSAR